MTEEQMREIFDDEFAREIRQAPLDRAHTEIHRRAALAAMRRVEAETIERCAKLAESRAAELDAWEREMAGDRSWQNIRGDGMREAAETIRDTTNKDGGE